MLKARLVWSGYPVHSNGQTLTNVLLGLLAAYRDFKEHYDWIRAQYGDEKHDLEVLHNWNNWAQAEHRLIRSCPLSVSSSMLRTWKLIATHHIGPSWAEILILIIPLAANQFSPDQPDATNNTAWNAVPQSYTGCIPITVDLLEQLDHEGAEAQEPSSLSAPSVLFWHTPKRFTFHVRLAHDPVKMETVDGFLWSSTGKLDASAVIDASVIAPWGIFFFPI